MQYVIYELIQPEHLQKVVSEGYGYTKTLYRNVMEELYVTNIESRHPTFETALKEIERNKEKLKHLELTILPFIRINYEGEIETL